MGLKSKHWWESDSLTNWSKKHYRHAHGEPHRTIISLKRPILLQHICPFGGEKERQAITNCVGWPHKGVIIDQYTSLFYVDTTLTRQSHNDNKSSYRC